MKLFIYTLFSIILLNSCGNTNEISKEENAHADSLLKIIKSPELEAINKQILNSPSDPLLYNQRASLYLNFKQFDEAINDVKRSLRIDTTNVNTYLLEADVFFAANETRNAKDVLEKISTKFPKNTDGLLKLGELYFFVKQYDLAFAKINEALKINENISKGYYLKGSIYKEIGDTAKAVSSFETAIEQDNKDYGAFLALGLIYASRKNLIAMEYYNNALAINPQSTEVLYAKGKLLQDNIKFDEAIEIYNKITSIDSTYKYAYYNIGAILLDSKQDAAKAIGYFDKAISSDLNYGEAYFARGVCNEKLNEKKKAYTDFTKCLELKPNYEPAIEALNALGK